MTLTEAPRLGRFRIGCSCTLNRHRPATDSEGHDAGEICHKQTRSVGRKPQLPEVHRPGCGLCRIPVRHHLWRHENYLHQWWAANRVAIASSIPHLHRHVALPMQHAPDIDMVLMLNIEHHVRVSTKRPGPEIGQAQLECVARGSDPGVSLYSSKCPPQLIDESQRCHFRAFAKVKIDGLVDIPVSAGPQPERLRLHLRRLRRAALLSDWK